MSEFKTRYKLVFSLILFVAIGFFIPENFNMPVEGANSKSYHPNSYWYYPWGKSGTHKGVDIFAKQGTAIHSSTASIVLFTGNIELGGNVVIALGPKWRLHYYAHLDQIDTKPFSLIGHHSKVGTVGSSGNAAGKPPHLHYSMVTLIPYPWRIDFSPQGWKKMFYLNPIDFLK